MRHPGPFKSTRTEHVAPSTAPIPLATAAQLNFRRQSVLKYAMCQRFLIRDAADENVGPGPSCGERRASSITVPSDLYGKMISGGNVVFRLLGNSPRVGVVVFSAPVRNQLNERSRYWSLTII